MNIGDAFSAIFHDRDWTTKLIIAGIIAFFTAITSWLLLGLVGAIILAGYQVEIVRRVRSGNAAVLPLWQDFGAFFSEGAAALLAYAIYMLPLMIFGIAAGLFGGVLGDAITGTIAIMMISCFLAPLSIIYFLFVTAMHAIAMGMYANDPQPSAFFRLTDLFETVIAQSGTTFQFVLNVFLLSVIVMLIAIIPCVGWIAAPALAVLIGGILAGQYADAVLGKPKRKNAER